MAFLEFLGCSMIAFGPTFSLFCVTIASCPIRVILFITAAFFWLVSLLFSSIIWCSASALTKASNTNLWLLAFGVVQAVFLQEIFRYIFYRILRKAEAGLRKIIEVGSDGPVVTDGRQTTAYVSGLGFGSMSGGFALMNVLAAISGPASVGLDDQSEWFMLVSSLTTCCFVLSNTSWGVILFHAYDMKDRSLIGGTILTHLTCSMLTLFNVNEIYYVSLPLIAIITFISMGLAFKTAGGRFDKLRCIFSVSATSESLTTS